MPHLRYFNYMEFNFRPVGLRNPLRSPFATLSQPVATGCQAAQRRTIGLRLSERCAGLWYFTRSCHGVSLCPGTKADALPELLVKQ